MATQIFPAKSNSQNKLCERQQKEMFFIYNHFMNYIKSNDSNANGNTYNPEYRINIFYQVLEYTNGLFSLSQLYSIFLSAKRDDGLWEYKELGDLKAKILKEIEIFPILCSKDLNDYENFKRKINEINPIILNVLIDLIYFSEIFLDREEAEYRIPEIFNNEIVDID